MKSLESCWNVRTRRRRWMTGRCRRRTSYGYPPLRILWSRERQRVKMSNPLGFRGMYGHRGPTSPKVVVMLGIGQVVHDQPISTPGELRNNRSMEVHTGQLPRSPTVKLTTLDNDSGWGTEQKILVPSVGHTMVFALCSYLTQIIHRDSEVHQQGSLTKA